MTTPLQPFTLAPVLVERPWGGDRLARYGKALGGQDRVGESWELADLPQHVAPALEDPQTRISSGPYSGASLRELISLRGNDLLGPVQPTQDGRFPLLIKLLDARENLSVQVHPPAAYVEHHPEARLKTESWYIVEAEPGSSLFLDLEQGVTLAEVADRIETGDIVVLGETTPRAYERLVQTKPRVLTAMETARVKPLPEAETKQLVDRWAQVHGGKDGEPVLAADTRRPLQNKELLLALTLRPAACAPGFPV